MYFPRNSTKSTDIKKILSKPKSLENAYLEVSRGLRNFHPDEI